MLEHRSVARRDRGAQRRRGDLDGRDAFAWSMVIRFPVRDGAGQHHRHRRVDVDITAQKRAEQALRASEARLAAFLEHAPVGMYLKDSKAATCWPTARWASLRPTGRGDDRPPRRPRSRRPRSRPRSSRRRGTVTEPGARVLVEEYIPTQLPIAGAGVPLSVARRQGCDDPHRRLPRRQLGAKARRVRRCAKASSASAGSPRRIRCHWSCCGSPTPPPVRQPGLYRDVRLFGSRARASLDKHELWADPAEREPYLARVAREDEVVDQEIMLKRRDGTIFPASMSSRVMEYAGEPALVTSVIDLSRQKEAEAEVERQREALHQSEKLAAFGQPARGRGARAQQPAVRGRRLLQHARRAGARRCSRRRAEARACGGRPLRPIVKAFLAMARQKPPKFGPVSAERGRRGRRSSWPRTDWGRRTSRSSRS